jgi:hypothetical protein
MADQPKSELRIRYLFGDATPFPLDENFVDTLIALTQACVSLFRAEVAAESRRAKAETARRHATDELAKLESLDLAIGDAVKSLLPTDPKSSGGVEAAAARIAKAARATIKQTRAGIHARRDAAVRVALGHRLPASIRESIEPFLVRHQLPSTRWSLRWHAGTRTDAASAEVRAVAPHAISVEFSTQLPVTGRWSGPMLVRDFAQRVEIRIAKPFRPGATLSVAVHKYVLTEVEASPKREAFTVRRSARKPSPGFHILMRGGQYSTPVVTPLDAVGEPVGDSQAIEGDAATHLTGLWRRILAGAPELVAARDTLVDLRLGEDRIDEIDSPGDLAEAMLQTVAPLVREIRMRSRQPGELVLKRDLGDGRREDVLLPRELLQGKISQLPPRFARLFDSVGMGLDATTEFMARELPLKPAGPPTELETKAQEPPDTEPQERLDASGDDKTIPRAKAPAPEPQSTPTNPLATVAGTIEAA